MTKHINKIEQLIAKLCPEGVEFKSIGEICQINRGRVMSKDYLKDNAGEYPVYSSQTADSGIFGRINTYDYDGEYLTWTTDGAYAGSIFYRNGKFSITNVCGLLKAKSSDLNMKFLSYILAIVSKNYVSSGMGNPKIMSNVMEKIKIPIPPLAIQEEIVKILDNFTALEAELEAELEARKKQYEYYRSRLVNYENKKTVKLAEVVNILRGKRLTKDQLSNYNKYPVYHGGLEPLGNYSSSNRKANTTMVINVGASAGTVGYSYVDFWSSDGCYCIEPSNQLISRYVYYALLCQENILRSKVRFAGIPTLDAKAVENLEIQVPSIEEQKRIVSILDKFDSLVNDISIGLPAELKARRQQYEYYRNKLLTFKEYAKQ